jgi:hypothetical protein
MPDELEYEPIEPEVVRGFYRELTRCDHCGVLDQQTERVTFDDEFFWLHEYCRENFRRPVSKLVYNNKRAVGAVMRSKQKWRAFKFIGSRLIDAGEFDHVRGAEYAAAWRELFPPAPPGWFRSRKHR